jgi:hypothetical protein
MRTNLSSHALSSSTGFSIHTSSGSVLTRVPTLSKQLLSLRAAVKKQNNEYVSVLRKKPIMIGKKGMPST